MFRAMYDAVRTRDPQVEPFSMNYRLFMSGRLNWWSSWSSRTLCLFYTPILTVGIIAIIAAASHWGA
jgi:hypothetical protein